MPDGDIYEATVQMSFFAQQVVNVHHFVQSGADGAGKAEDAVDVAWANVFKTALRNIMTDDVTINALSIRRIKPTQTQPTVYGYADNGLATGESLPTHCCAIVTQLAEPAGRKGTGHVKIAGVPSDEVKGGRISGDYATDLNTYGDGFEAEIITPSAYRFFPAVYSQIDSVARPILKAGGRTRVRTVHSRQFGVGD